MYRNVREMDYYLSFFGGWFSTFFAVSTCLLRVINLANYNLELANNLFDYEKETSYNLKCDKDKDEPGDKLDKSPYSVTVA